MTGLTLRKANADDCDTVFEWRNHPQVRTYFFDPRELSYAEHKTWFFESLDREDRILLVAHRNGKAVGVIRFDLKGPEGRTAEIDIYVDPKKAGQGLGKQMMGQAEAWLRRNTSIQTLFARVKEENLASVKMFKGCKFATDFIQFRKDL
jgi:RimJ/RimL family protein N-acetyltransferase